MVTGWVTDAMPGVPASAVLTWLALDAVEITSLDGRVFARGLAVYGAEEVRRIKGLRSGQIEATLGYRLLDCVVHRDDLVVTR